MPTKNNLITKIYNNQRTNSKRRSHSLPNYSKEELKDWLFSQKLFHELYNNWKNNNYISELSPSIDRENSYLPYSFNNNRLTTWGENNRKGNEDRKNGVNNKNSKPVVQYSLTGEFIKEYCSQMQAGRITGINNTSISLVCRSKLKSAGGYIFKFKTKLK